MRFQKLLHSLVAPIIQRRYDVMLICVVLIGFFLISRMALLRHWGLGSYHFDLGNMLQAVATTAQGKFLVITDPYTFQQTSRLAYHFDPILALLAPLYILYPYAETLILVQAFVVVLGAIPVYLIASDMLGHKRYGLVCAVWYLMYYPIQRTVLFDFHAVTLSTSLLLWMFYFAKVQRFKASLLCMSLALLTKENVPLITSTFGLYHVVVNKNTRFGWSVFFASLLVFGVVMGLVIPASRQGGAHFADSYFSRSVPENIRQLFRIESVRYIHTLLLPTGYMALLSPATFFIALPELLINMLSKNSNMRDLQYHYSALISPFIIVSSIYGVKVLSRAIQLKVILGGLTALIFITMLGNSPILSGRTVDVAERQTVLQWQEKLRDPKVKVAATGHLSPYFAGREYFYNFFFDFAYRNQGFSDEDLMQLVGHYNFADYVLIKESEITSHKLVQYYYQDLVRNQLYRKIYDNNGIEVYKKIL